MSGASGRSRRARKSLSTTATTPLITTVRGKKKFSIGRKRSSYKEIVALSLVTKLLMVDFFVVVLSECGDTEQLEWQVLRARYLGSIFDFTSSQMWESNPGWLGEKRERFLCAMPSPQYLWSII